MTAKQSKKTAKKLQVGSKPQEKTPADYMQPLYMNGLQGRMLHMPPPSGKKREILIVYGHHASLERMFGVAEFFNKYGGVTLPDLPGFGGMQPFYKIGKKPTVDNLADYLASFIKLRYKRRLTIMGTSFGFVVVTRMLQRYPEIAKRVDVLVSFVGFVHKEDFHMGRRDYWALRAFTAAGTNRFVAFGLQHVLFQPPLVRMVYNLVAERNDKLKDAEDIAERKALIDFETYLWQCNHARTQCYTGNRFLRIDLCDNRVDLPVYHVCVENDRYFDNNIVEQHLNLIYNKVHMLRVSIGMHAPTVVASAKQVAPFIPMKLRRVLSRSD